MSARVSIEDQVASVRREIRMRESVYPRRIAAGKLTERKAAEELLAMQAVLETLLEIEAKARLL